jgi:hypothetical protein
LELEKATGKLERPDKAPSKRNEATHHFYLEEFLCIQHGLMAQS